MSCPPPDRLTRFVADSLADAERSVVEAHLEECDECRALVAMLVRMSGAPGGVALPLERYVLGRVLGRGGMGVVYAARDPALDRDIAIKVLRSDFARADPDAARRIAREAQVMARISHPNVVAVFDVGTHDDQVFIAMELVSGGSLRSWLRRGERSVAEILALFVAAGRGLIAAHDAGVVHRDFKPDNVLVGDDGRVRVTDFGIAGEHVEAAAGADAAAALAASHVAGTPEYMAPEQFEGGNLDPRSDQFSFCVALYEALYGVRPFAGATFEALGDAVTQGRIEPAPADARIPASLRAILLRGMAVAPGDRFPTLAALLTALSRDRGRQPRRVAAGAAVLLACVCVGLAADWFVRDRLEAVTQTSFAATGAQLNRLVALRADAFAAQADALYAQGPVQAIAATRSDADFGLGSPSDDHARFEHIHDTLAAASWVRLARTGPGYEIAIADEKGRLLFDTATPALWGKSITDIPAIDVAYQTTVETSIGVIRADDPVVVASGVLGDGHLTGLYVLFARVRLGANSRPQAAFVQLIPAAGLVGEVFGGDEDGAEPTRLSLVAPDGTVEGSVAPALAARITSDRIAELTVDGETWFVQRTPLRAPGQRAGVSRFVLARRADVLFPATRLVLALAAAGLALVALGGLWLARSRDLGRRGERGRRRTRAVPDDRPTVVEEKRNVNDVS